MEGLTFGTSKQWRILGPNPTLVLQPLPFCNSTLVLQPLLPEQFNKEFAVSGLGMVFKFQRFQLALGSVVEQPIEKGMLLSKWATS